MRDFYGEEINEYAELDSKISHTCIVIVHDYCLACEISTASAIHLKFWLTN